MDEERGFKLFYFVFFASFSGYVMFRNVYFEEIGLTGTQMGMIGFLIPLCTIIAQPLWGLLADWKGLSKLILYISAILGGLGVLLYPLAPHTDATLAIVAIATIFYAIFRAPTMPIANALVLSTGVSYESVRVYGSISFGIAGVAIGYLIGIFETTLIFFVYSFGMGCLVALLLFLPVREQSIPGGDLSWETIRPLLNRPFLLLLSAAFLLGMMAPAGAAFFSVYVRAVGHPDAITGVAWLVKTIAEAIAFLYIARRGGGSYRSLMAIGGLLYASTYVVLWLTGAVALIILAQLLLGVGYALFNLASVNLAHVLSPPELKSTAQSLLIVGGSSAGLAVGELGTGRLLDLVGAQDMYGILAVLGIIVAVVSMTISGGASARLDARQAVGDD